ncbi:MAG: hypothetical protein AAGF73_13810 [Actinomycetota bacterium]
MERAGTAMLDLMADHGLDRTTASRGAVGVGFNDPNFINPAGTLADKSTGLMWTQAVFRGGMA